jgi:WD40 repeat protein
MEPTIRLWSVDNIDNTSNDNNDGNGGGGVEAESNSNCLLKLKRHHCGYIYSVAFCPTGRMLATRGSDMTLRLWSPIEATGDGDYDEAIRLWGLK